MFPTRFFAALAAVALCFLAPASRAEIVVNNGWVRATVPGADSGAGYLTITNTGTEARSLLRLTSTVSDTVTIHQSSIDAQGMARMWPVAKLEIKPGETVKFAPNGRHLMFNALTAPFRVGETVPVTFQFDRGSEPVTAQLTVRPLVDEAAEPGTGKSSDHRH
jgi:periplasmic copper chaperone A